MGNGGYDWENGAFNASCVCGGSINRPNPDCERCAMHDWSYKQQAKIERLTCLCKDSANALIEWCKAMDIQSKGLMDIAGKLNVSRDSGGRET